MIRIDVSTHPESTDKIVRVMTVNGVLFVPMTEWSRALANVGQFSPDFPEEHATPLVAWVEIV